MTGREAACAVLVAAGAADAEWWTGDATGALRGRAADVCGACPLAAACLTEGVTGGLYGLWGGVWLAPGRGMEPVPGEATWTVLDAGGRQAWREWRRAAWPVLAERLAEMGVPVGGACGDAVGTSHGYNRHTRAGLPPCDACREGRSDARRNGSAHRPDTQHGTTAGVAWHYRYDMPLCEECRGAANRYNADRRARRAAARPAALAPPSDVCGAKRGTPTGRSRHQAAFERPCEACREAHNRARRKPAS